MFSIGLLSCTLSSYCLRCRFMFCYGATDINSGDNNKIMFCYGATDINSGET